MNGTLGDEEQSCCCARCCRCSQNARVMPGAQRKVMSMWHCRRQGTGRVGLEFRERGQGTQAGIIGCEGCRRGATNSGPKRVIERDAINLLPPKPFDIWPRLSTEIVLIDMTSQRCRFVRLSNCGIRSIRRTCVELLTICDWKKRARLQPCLDFRGIHHDNADVEEFNNV